MGPLVFRHDAAATSSSHAHPAMTPIEGARDEVQFTLHIRIIDTAPCW